MGASYGKQKNASKGKLNIGRFTPLPHNVMRSKEFRALGYSARCLLFDLAMQFSGKNNGGLVCCDSYLKPLQWVSNGTVSRALKELRDSGLIIQTRQGMKPPCSQAAWFALSWLELDVTEGLDIEPKLYRRAILTPFLPLTKLKYLHP